MGVSSLEEEEGKDEGLAREGDGRGCGPPPHLSPPRPPLAPPPPPPPPPAQQQQVGSKRGRSKKLFLARLSRKARRLVKARGRFVAYQGGEEGSGDEGDVGVSRARRRPKQQDRDAAEAEARISKDEAGASAEAGAERFRAYYAAQRLFSGDDRDKEEGGEEGEQEELHALVEALRRPLPVSFRVNAARPAHEARKALQRIQDFLPAGEEEEEGQQEEEEEEEDGAEGGGRGGGHAGRGGAQGFPELRCYQLEVDDREIRVGMKREQGAPSNNSFARGSMRVGGEMEEEGEGGDDEEGAGAYGRLHGWLVSECSSGLVTRQEVVSCVPVALLAVKASSTVLDTCASPGSKTGQALAEMVDDARASGRVFGVSDGLGHVVANEVSRERAHVLAARVSATCASSGEGMAGVMVAQHRAQTFPAVASFDRILCDVPCSGDGTFRKHPAKWTHWQAHQGRGHHALQLQIALRAFALLEVGGRMVYSTCSFNPLENEAVVAGVLRAAGGAAKTVECRDLLGHRIAEASRPGLATWAVLDSDGVSAHPTHAACLAAEGGSAKARFRPSMWPPESSSDTATQLASCVRLYPHLTDTGGFFACVLTKVKAWPTRKKNSEESPTLPRAARPAAGGQQHQEHQEQQKRLVLAVASREWTAKGLGCLPLGAPRETSAPGKSKATVSLVAHGARSVLCLRDALVGMEGLRTVKAGFPLAKAASSVRPSVARDLPTPLPAWYLTGEGASALGAVLSSPDVHRRVPFSVSPGAVVGVGKSTALRLLQAPFCAMPMDAEDLSSPSPGECVLLKVKVKQQGGSSRGTHHRYLPGWRWPGHLAATLLPNEAKRAMALLEEGA